MRSQALELLSQAKEHNKIPSERTATFEGRDSSESRERTNIELEKTRQYEKILTLAGDWVATFVGKEDPRDRERIEEELDAAAHEYFEGGEDCICENRRRERRVKRCA
ncbi:uncharacterized protein LTR77_009490 [Saxophila tyrrhenica]|uniref:Uncharacterized protein n=1 Tax=Saxophila tyrrhenica TaxID=1690608 RepID=A0AAV9NXS0_9PEZI|nr:hypothetical protein LTR77_009490 [Saxophila tyrrhenica]